MIITGICFIVYINNTFTFKLNVQMGYHFVQHINKSSTDSTGVNDTRDLGYPPKKSSRVELEALAGQLTEPFCFIINDMHICPSSSVRKTIRPKRTNTDGN